MLYFVVSACLAGVPCRYDGASKPCPAVQDLVRAGQALPLCPEALGDLPVPRLPCEQQADGRIVDKEGMDRTAAFVRGAQAALAQALAHGCAAAILKSRSPSCGIDGVYDGTFSGRLRPGEGLWAKALREQGLTLYSEEDLPPLPPPPLP